MFGGGGFGGMGGYGGGMPGMGGGGFGYGGLGNLQDASLFSGGQPGSLSDTNANIGGQLGTPQDQNSGLNAFAQASPQQAAQAAGSPADQTNNAISQLVPPQGPSGFTPNQLPLGSSNAPGEVTPAQTLFANPPPQDPNAGSSLVGMGVPNTGAVAPAASAPGATFDQRFGGNAAPTADLPVAADTSGNIGTPYGSMPGQNISGPINQAQYPASPDFPSDQGSALAGTDTGNAAANYAALGGNAGGGGYTPLPDQLPQQTVQDVRDAQAAAAGGWRPPSTANAGSPTPATGNQTQASTGSNPTAAAQSFHQGLQHMGMPQGASRLLGDLMSLIGGHGNPMQLLQDLISMLSGGAMGMQGQGSGMLQTGQSVNWRGRHLRYLGNGRFVDDRGDIIDGNSGQVVGHQGSGNGRAPATDPSNPPGTQANPTPIRT
jgi:hypothetical protein